MHVTTSSVCCFHVSHCLAFKRSPWKLAAARSGFLTCFDYRGKGEAIAHLVACTWVTAVEGLIVDYIMLTAATSLMEQDMEICNLFASKTEVAGTGVKNMHVTHYPAPFML